MGKSRELQQKATPMYTYRVSMCNIISISYVQRPADLLR
jgi:hypothetical protein